MSPTQKPSDENKTVLVEVGTYYCNPAATPFNKSGSQKPLTAPCHNMIDNLNKNVTIKHINTIHIFALFLQRLLEAIRLQYEMTIVQVKKETLLCISGAQHQLPLK